MQTLIVKKSLKGLFQCPLFFVFLFFCRTFAAENQNSIILWTIIRRKLLNSKAGGTAGKTANPLAANLCINGL